MNACSVSNLTKHYPGFDLGPVSFQVPAGTIMGFVGENGAGKTTTIKSLLGIVRPDGGEVALLGGPYSGEERALKERLGVVFAESHFHDNLTLGDVDRILGHIYRTWDRGWFRQACERFELPGGKAVKDYSKGMQMKLNILAALAHHPTLLILDEATSGLDPIVREQMLDLFLEFMQDETHAILFSSHITSDLDKIADAITFIHQGQIVFSKSRDALMDEMGVIRVGEQQLRSLPAGQVVRVRRDAFGVEALVQDRVAVAQRLPGVHAERVNIEQIMLFYVRGEAL